MMPAAPTPVAVAALIAAESALVVWAAAMSDRYAIGKRVVALNMMLIALFGPALLSLGGVVSNIGNINYAAAVAAQCVVLETHGPHQARQTVAMVSRMMVALYLLTLCMSLFPVVDGNGDYMAAMRLIVERRADVLAASLAAFVVSQAVLIRAWLMVRARHSFVLAALLAALACQSVDTPLFFVVAFARTTGADEIIAMASAGLLIKAGCAVAFLPACLLAVHLRRSPRRVSATP